MAQTPQNSSSVYCKYLLWNEDKPEFPNKPSLPIAVTLKKAKFPNKVESLKTQ